MHLNPALKGRAKFRRRSAAIYAHASNNPCYYTYMPLITKSDLRWRAATYRKNTGQETKSYKRMLEEENPPSPLNREYTIFLSHSYLDVQEILGLSLELRNCGHLTYVDSIEDFHLDRENVTRQTADILRIRMQHCKCLFYATSVNSSLSKWMPWEAGYFDGIKGRVAIVPILDTAVTGDAYEGREYLSLYPYVTFNYPSDTGKPVLYINDDEDTYVSFSRWLQDEKPVED